MLGRTYTRFGEKGLARPASAARPRRLGVALLAAVIAIGAAGVGRADPNDIQIDNVSTQGPQSGTTVSWNHTVGTGATMLIVAVASISGGFMVPGITVLVDGDPVSEYVDREDDTSNGDFVWKTRNFFISSPSAGSHSISATFDDVGAQYVGAAISILKSETTPADWTTENSNHGENPTRIALEGVSPRDLALGTLAIGGSQATINGTCSPSGIETVRWDLNACNSTPNGFLGVTAPGGVVPGGGSSGGITTLDEGFDASNGWVMSLTRILPALTPTSISLREASAVAGGGGASVRWRAADGGWNLGYRLHREVGGRRTPASGLLAGNALQVADDAGVMGQGAYVWQDDVPPLPGTRYWIEEIDLDTRSVLYGPYPVVHGPAAPLPGTMRRASPLAELGRRLAPGRERFVLPRPSAEAPSLRALRVEGPPACAALAARPGVKLLVAGDGWTRVSGQALREAGLGDGDPRRLALHLEGRPVPMRVLGEEDGRLDDGDAIELYARGSATPWSPTRSYWLAEGASGPGPRLETRSAAPATREVATSWATVERADKAVYAAAIKNGRADNFFGAVVTGKPLEQPIALGAVDRGPGAPATLEVQLRGATEAAHQVAVALNGQRLGVVKVDQQQAARATFTVPVDALLEGENRVTLTSELGATDVSVVEAIRVGYRRGLVAVGDELPFVAQAGDAATITGFSGGAVRVMDVTDPESATELPVEVSADPGGFRARVVASGRGSRTLLAFGPAGVKAPAAVRSHRPASLLESTRGAQLVLLAPGAWLPAVEPLARRRRDEGWKVATADVQDVFDAFNCGDKSPQALREYLRAARPSHALLVGGASFDPRNHLGLGDRDFVPTQLVETTTIETASDDWFGDLDDDGVAEIAIGRLPAASLAEAIIEIDKVVDYHGAPGSGGWQNEAVLVADREDGWDFAATSAEVKGALPSGMLATTLQRTDQAQPALVARLEQGAGLVSYAGHGSVAEWATAFTARDARALTNGDRLPVFVNMTCLNGLFHDPRIESLGQALLAAPHGGAIAVWASTASPDARQQALANVALVKNLGRGSLGAAVRAAKLAVTDPDLRTSFVLLGDPTLFGSPPAEAPPPPADVPDAGAPLEAGASVPAAPDGGGCALATRQAPGPAATLVVAAQFAWLRGRRRRS